jgi:hypothetical protein
VDCSLFLSLFQISFLSSCMYDIHWTLSSRMIALGYGRPRTISVAWGRFLSGGRLLRVSVRCEQLEKLRDAR